MGYIDSDTHVLETEATWSYLSADEARFRPQVRDTDGSQEQFHGLTRFWDLDGQLAPRGLTGHTVPGQPPDSVRALDDPAGRVSWMDDLGVDTQVIIPSFFLAMLISDAPAQIALAHSYNRWMADCCRDSNGRLRWCLVPPLLDMDAAVEEVHFGADNGAASVLMRPLECSRLLTDPYFHPLYAAAERRGLAIGVHIGNTGVPVYAKLEAVMYTIVPMAAAFVTLFVSDFSERFRNLHFGFLEAGSEWLPYAFREISRGAETARRQDVKLKETPLASTNFFIDCTFDEDLPYVLKFAGGDNLVLGSDFGHSDFGTDMGAHGMLLERTDVDKGVLKKITEDNGRRLYGLD